MLLKNLFRFTGLVSLLLIALSEPLLARERITHFDSDIQIRSDRTLLVTETIAVIAEHVAIRHGIYREFPTVYPHPRWGLLGFKEKTGFSIISIKLDGVDTDWKLKRLNNGVRFHIGDPNSYISPGPHVFEIQYVTDQQIARVDDIDFLNWNVNGQGWVFPIDKITASVQLTDNQKITDYTAWTGEAGSREVNYTTIENPDGSVHFTTTRVLRPYEGLTVSLQLPQGSLPPPKSNLSLFIKNNIKWIIGLLLLLAMPLYYLHAWLAVGRDPQRGSVFADYHPVRGLSAAAHHFISTNSVNNSTFTAVLVSLAVKGYLRIEQESKKSYTLYKTPNQAEASVDNTLSPGEKIVYDSLFSADQSQINLGEKYIRRVAKSRNTLEKYLKKEWREAIYMDNRRFSWSGLVIGAAALTLCGLHLSNAELSFGHLVPMLVFVLAGVALTHAKFRSVVLSGAGIFFAFGMQNTNFSLFGSQAMLWLSLMVAILFAFFSYLLKAPTPFGQKLLDEIEGFRLYLSTAEQHRLNILHPPDKTPQLFEKLLPYAIALGVENHWSEQFSDVFKQALEEDKAYSPVWYKSANRLVFSGQSLGSGLSSGLNSSVAAASTAPSSSTGGFSSGGGGAGSGGGGGGGGGW